MLLRWQQMPCWPAQVVDHGVGQQSCDCQVIVRRLPQVPGAVVLLRHRPLRVGIAAQGVIAEVTELRDIKRQRRFQVVA